MIYSSIYSEPLSLMPRVKSPARSKYKPHQGLKEKFRRVSQMKTNLVRFIPGDEHERGLVADHGEVWKVLRAWGHIPGAGLFYRLISLDGLEEFTVTDRPHSPGGWRAHLVPIKTHSGKEVG